MLKGYWPYATPIGYQNLKPKHRACFHEYVITEEGKELKRAFQLKVEGKLTNREIIARLNVKGLKVSEKNFRHILSNPFYAGYVTGNLVEGKLIKGKHPALIDLKTFLKANELLKQVSIAGVAKKFRQEDLPLKRFAFNETGENAFTGYRTKGIWYYKTKQGAVPVNVRADQLNALFVQTLQTFEYDKSTTKKAALGKVQNKVSDKPRRKHGT